ncbi:MAG: leucine-rich repeat domain-containing protein [Spirochaetales bacterium]|nr:leucine-rich repeat domain-containing protein [Spirochaetales bacterium]
MKYKSIVLLIIFLVLTIPLHSQQNIKVKFEDPGLEQAIRKTIDKPSGDIYASELKGLKELDGEDFNIISLKGIEYCTSLEELYLSNNQIGDLSPLIGLSSLKAIWIYRNPLSGVTKNDIIPKLKKNGVKVEY